MRVDDFGSMMKRGGVVGCVSDTIRTSTMSRTCVLGNREKSKGQLLTGLFTVDLRYRGHTRSKRTYKGYRSYGRTRDNGRPSVVGMARRGPGAVDISSVHARIGGSVIVGPCDDGCGVCVVPRTSLVDTRTRGTLLGAVRRPPRCTIVVLLARGTRTLLPAVHSEYIVVGLHGVGSRLMGGCLVRRVRVPSCGTSIYMTFTRKGVKGTVVLTASRCFGRVGRRIMRLLEGVSRVGISRLVSTIGGYVACGVRVGSCLSVVTV